MRENLISLHHKVKSSDDAVTYLQENNILKTQTKCEKCEKTLVNTVENKTDSCIFFRCRPCGFKESIRKGTFLFGKVGKQTFSISTASP